MPQGFDNCVKSGGRVRTKSLGNGKYQRFCFKDGKSFAGEVKEKKKTTVREATGAAAKKVTYTPEKVERRPWEKPAKAQFKRL